MNHKYDLINGVASASGGVITPNYINSDISGELSIDNLTGVVNGILNTITISYPNFIRDIKQLEEGQYGSIIVFGNLDSNYYLISGIYDIELDDFKYREITVHATYDPVTDQLSPVLGSPITPGTSYYRPRFLYSIFGLRRNSATAFSRLISPASTACSYRVNHLPNCGHPSRNSAKTRSAMAPHSGMNPLEWKSSSAAFRS